MATRSALSIFVCDACGGETPKWQGQCPHCAAWNTLVQRTAPVRTAGARQRAKPAAKPKALGEGLAEAAERLHTGQAELDRVLGGGIVPGSVTLLGGDPGIGKSTLLLQVAAHVAGAHTVVYASGEESVSQVALRGRRLGLGAAALQVLCETDLQSILDQSAVQRAALLV